MAVPKSNLYDGLHHVSIVVTDIDRAKHFYGEILGFEEKERPFKSKGAWYGVGQTEVHLIVSHGKTLRGTNTIDDSDGHFALRVRDIQELIQLLQEAAIPYVDRPVNLTPWHQVYITDLDGNVIEFNAPKA